MDNSRISEVISPVVTGTIELEGGTLIGHLADAEARGYSIQYIWDGTKLGIKTENQTEYQFVDLKGETGTSIDSVFMDEYYLYVRLSDGQVIPIGNIRGPEGHVDITSYKDIPDAPTKLSEFVNDGGFVGITDVNKMITNAAHMNKKVVNELPSVEDAEENTIYFVLKNKIVSITDIPVSNSYDVYMLIGEVFELVGGTEIDLTGYLKDSDLEEFTDADFEEVIV